MRQAATTLDSEMSPNEIAFLTSLIRKHAFTGKHLEIGTAAGGTLCLMIKAASKTQPLFVAVDPMTYFQDQANVVRKNLKNNGIDPASVDIRETRSNLALRAAERKGETFDLILIDAAHKIKYVMQDLRWARLLNPNGILLLHDYHPQTKDVVLPVNRFLKRYKSYQIIGRADSLLAIQKKSKSKKKEVSSTDYLYSWLMAPVMEWRRSWLKRLRKMKKR